MRREKTFFVRKIPQWEPIVSVLLRLLQPIGGSYDAATDQLPCLFIGPVPRHGWQDIDETVRFPDITGGGCGCQRNDENTDLGPAMCHGTARGTGAIIELPCVVSGYVSIDGFQGYTFADWHDMGWLLDGYWQCPRIPRIKRGDQ